MKVRQSDIAAALGISRTTVARALNASGYVDEETRKKIFELSNDIQYRKNLFASSLALKNNLNIHCAYVKTYNNSFVRSMEAGFKAAEMQFASYGLNFSFSSASSEAPLDQIRDLSALDIDKLDALIVMPLLEHEVSPIVSRMTEKGIPVITLVMDLPDSGRFAFVGSDNYKGGRIAAELYAKLLDGKGRILAFSTDYKYAMPTDRFRGFLDKISQYPDIQLEGPVSVGAFREMYEHTRGYLAGGTPLDAIYTVTDLSYPARALYDYDTEYKTGGKLKALKLIAMDDDEPTREFLGLGYIDAIVGQRPFIQGYIAMKLMTEALLHKHKRPQVAPPIEYDILLNENISQFDNAAYFETIFRSL